MDISKKDIDLLDALIRDDLDPNLKEELLRRIDSDEELKSKYEFLVATAEAGRRSNLDSKLEMLKSLESQYRTSDAASSKKGLIAYLNPWISVAAGIAIIAVSIFLIKGEGVNRTLIDSRFVHVTSDLKVNRSDVSGNDEDKRIKAYSLYEVNSYKEAAPLLLSLYQSENDTTSLYFAALSYLASYNLKTAAQYLSHPALAETDFEIDYYLQIIEDAQK